MIECLIAAAIVADAMMATYIIQTWYEVGVQVWETLKNAASSASGSGDERFVYF